MACLINLKLSPSGVKYRAGNIVPTRGHYPLINLKSEHYNTSASDQGLNVKDIFIPVESESVLKRISRTFFDGGFWESMDEARSQKTREQSPWISTTADCIANFLELYKTLELKTFPHTQELSVDRIAEYAETRDWINSEVRCIAWHHDFLKLAVVGNDDVVRVYWKITDRNAGNGPVIKSPSQIHVTCMAWRPQCDFELVVGCRQGLCFWIIDNNLQLGRNIYPSQICVHPSKLPISSLQWNSDGRLLATASLGDRAVLLWDVDNGSVRALKRLGPPGSLLRWSPANDFLFSSTIGGVFRVWKCSDDWTIERYVSKSGHVQSSCWSPCGSFLLFVEHTKPILYYIRFVQLHLDPSSSSPIACPKANPNSFGWHATGRRLYKPSDRLYNAAYKTANENDKEVIPIADLTACLMEGQKSTIVGGPAQQLAMDPHGKYIAITFQVTNSIAIFRTSIGKYDFQISGGHYINGETPSEYPSFICFQPLNMDNDESVLTIGWSTGRIQFYGLD